MYGTFVFDTVSPISSEWRLTIYSFIRWWGEVLDGSRISHDRVKSRRIDLARNSTTTVPVPTRRRVTTVYDYDLVDQILFDARRGTYTRSVPPGPRELREFRPVRPSFSSQLPPRITSTIRRSPVTWMSAIDEPVNYYSPSGSDEPHCVSSVPREYLVIFGIKHLRIITFLEIDWKTDENVSLQHPRTILRWANY